MAETTIEWATDVWNPVTGCNRVSEGCDRCYALKLARRLKRMGNPRYQIDGDPVTSGPGFGLTLHWDKLDEPLRWRKPRRVFVNSMSDLGHELIPFDFFSRVFDTMAAAPDHQFLILTKRQGALRSRVRRWYREQGVQTPLPNVWIGVSVENQHWANVRIPVLLGIPAKIRFLSCEPLLGPIDLDRWLPEIHSENHVITTDEDGATCLTCGIVWPGLLHWVIVGGESGLGPEGEIARPMNPTWARGLRDQAVRAGVPWFFKQWGSWSAVPGKGRLAVFPEGGQVWYQGPAHNAGGRTFDGRTWDEAPKLERRSG